MCCLRQLLGSSKQGFGATLVVARVFTVAVAMSGTCVGRHREAYRPLVMVMDDSGMRHESESGEQQ